MVISSLVLGLTPFLSPALFHPKGAKADQLNLVAASQSLEIASITAATALSLSFLEKPVFSATTLISSVFVIVFPPIYFNFIIVQICRHIRLITFLNFPPEFVQLLDAGGFHIDSPLPSQLFYLGKTSDEFLAGKRLAPPPASTPIKREIFTALNNKSPNSNVFFLHRAAFTASSSSSTSLRRSRNASFRLS